MIMNAGDVARVRAAVHQFLLLARVIDHDSRQYREGYETTMRRIDEVEADGRKKRRAKARRWREQMEAVKPHGDRVNGRGS